MKYYSDENTFKSQEPGILEYIYVVILVLYAGRSLMFFESPLIESNPIGVILPVLMSGILAFKWRLFFSIEFYMLLFFFALYFIAVSIKYYEIRPTFLLTYYFLFFTGYTAVRVLKFNLFLIYEKVVYFLAAISLVLWGIQVLAGGDFLYNIIGRISFLDQISFVSGRGLSTIFYVIQSYETTLINGHTISRNCGFAWEPGSFSSYLALAIFINLFLAAKDSKQKKRFWVLLIALFSTMSTTGYFLFSVIIIYYFFNKEFKKVVLMLPALAGGLILLFSLPFMKDKIVELVKEPSRIDFIVWDSFGRESATTPQRFSSLLITLIDFKNNPVLGIAAHADEQWTRQAGSNISTVSGIGNLLAQFGIVGFIPFLIFSIKSSITFSKYFNYKGRFLLFFIILGISVSYSILFIPLIMCFWMFSLFEPDILSQKEATNRVIVSEAGF
ncbi:MAG TPA: hypothetical protein VHO50_12050 [Bacteroidales bacterium]|nr:hypothetical protein [Bacteroidales bacterium]